VSGEAWRFAVTPVGKAYLSFGLHLMPKHLHWFHVHEQEQHVLLVLTASRVLELSFPWRGCQQACRRAAAGKR